MPMDDKPAGADVSNLGTDADGASWVARIPWWRRGMAVAAALIGVLDAIWFVRGGPGGGIGVLFTFVAAIPGFAPARSFGRFCLAFGVVLFVTGVLGILLGLFVYVPVAVMLLLAWLADPGVMPRLAPLIAVVDAAVFVLMTIVLGTAIAS